MSRDLTDRQQQVLTIIQGAQEKGESFPTLESIAQKMGIGTKAGVVGHIKALEKKGFIKRRESTPRPSPFSLCEAYKPKPQSFPFFGAIAAGAARELYNESESDRIEFDPDFFGGGKLCAVEVSGESMNGDAIFNGDIAIIKMDPVFKSNDILAVRVNKSEIALKRLKQKGQDVQLISSNPDYDPMNFHASEIEVLGRFVGLVRKN